MNTIIETAREYKRSGRKLTLVAIGALTNVALALHLAPDIVDALEVRIMGGHWGRHEAEWNIRCDPEAAAMVFGSGVRLTVVSIDVTEKVTLSDEQVQMLAQSPHEGARFLGELVRLWGHVVTLHDPLTLLSLFSDVVTFEPMHIKVELCGAVRALTKRTDGEPNAHVSTEVRVEDAKKLFMERVLRKA